MRETVAQALAAAVQPLSLPSVQRVMAILHEMQAQREWGVRHSGFIGVKYCLAARAEAAQQLLPSVLPVLLQGLQDADDDVRAAAAEALVPMVPALLTMGPQVSPCAHTHTLTCMPHTRMHATCLGSHSTCYMAPLGMQTGGGAAARHLVGHPARA